MDKIYSKVSKQPTIAQFLVHHIMHCRGQWIETYSDKECNYEQCHTEANRSFRDLLALVNTYYPNTSVEELFKILLSINIKMVIKDVKYDFKFNAFFCDDVNLFICYYYQGTITFSSIKTSKEYSEDESEGEYNWYDLLLKIGINSQEELEKFQEDNIINIDYETKEIILSK